MARVIVQAPGALPLLGHALRLRRDPLRFLESLPAYGDLVGIRVGALSAVAVCDPDLTVEMLRDDRIFDKGGAVIDAQKEVAGSNLLTCPSHQHRRLRRLIQPAFHSSRMPGHATLMNRQIDSVVGAWQDGQIVDVQMEMYRMAIGVVYATIVGNTISAQTLTQLVGDLKEKNTALATRALMPRLLGSLPTLARRRYHRAISRISQRTDDILATHRAGAPPGTLSSIMSRTPDASTSPTSSAGRLSEPEVRNNLGMFVLAGSDTTANTVAWAVHLLTQHPDIQQRLHTEIDTVLAGATATAADLPRLTLTGNVLTETLRLYPVAWISTRTATTDTQLGGYRIPAGTTLFWSPYLIHRRADLYPDPTRFDPDRWSGQPPTGPSSGEFIAFSAGARKCIGDTFARVEATLVLAAVISRWRLDPVPGPPVRPLTGSLLTPSQVIARITTRNPTHGAAGEQCT